MWPIIYSYNNEIIFAAPTTMMSDGLRNILSAMEKNNVKIVSVCLSSNYFCNIIKLYMCFFDITVKHLVNFSLFIL
jgi:hypothetical protein